MKQLLTFSLLLYGISVYAADGSSSNKTESLDKLFIAHAVASARRDGRTTEYGEYWFNDKGDPSELRAVNSGDTHYEFYPQTMCSITDTTTAEELTKNIQEGGPFEWKQMVAYLYCDGNKVDPKDLIIAHSPLISWPTDDKVWDIRKNAAKWAIVHFKPGASIKDKVPKALRMGREGRKFIKTTENTYKKINQEATERVFGKKDKVLENWNIVEKNS